MATSGMKHPVARWSDLWITTAYVIGSGIWVVGSDIVLHTQGFDRSLEFAGGIGKGLAFVLASGLILYLALRVVGRHRDAALRDARAAAGRLDAFFLGNPLAVLVTNPSDGRILDANIAAVEMLGLTREQIRHLYLFELADAPAGELRDWVDAAVARRIEPLRIWLTAAGGAVRHLEFHPYPIADDGPLVLYVTLVDRTGEAHAEAGVARFTKLLLTVITGIRATMSSRDRTSLAREVCRALVAEAGYSLAWIGDVGAGSDEPIRIVGEAGGKTRHADGAFPAGSPPIFRIGPVDLVLQNGQPQRVRDLVDDAADRERRDFARVNDLRSCIILPMVTGGRVASMLAIYAAKPDAFADQDLPYLQDLAADLGMSLSTFDSWVRVDESERGRLAALKRSRKSLLQLVAALSHLIGTHDPYTADHARRVASLARRVGHRLGMADDKLEALEIAGILHDIGKIAVPSEILAKSGKLSGAEMALVREHVRIGIDVLDKITFDSPIAAFVGQHHERLDGSGYPNGLSGDAILPESRILAVCDVAEAMLSHRPYRPGRPMDYVVKELTDGRDRRYDARAVDACLAILTEEGLEPTPAPFTA